MKFKKIILLILVFVVVCNIHVQAQTDTSFWFAAPAITPSHENTPIVIRLSSYSAAADVTISEPTNPSFLPYTIHLNAYDVRTVDLTSQINMVENKPAYSVLNYGIHVQATANISAYYEEGQHNNPELFPLKGNVGEGTNFLIPAQTRFGDWAGLPIPAHNGFIIVATQDNTSVTITLSQNASTHAANTPFTIILNKGQTYTVIADGTIASAHLGGSFVQSDKPISITIYDDSVDATTVCSNCPCKDLIGDQIVPINRTGQEYIIVRGDLAVPTTGDYYYIWATEDNTTISVDGVLVTTINKGKSYEGILTEESSYIVTNKNVYVYQLTGVNCEMASTNLPSINCTGSQLVSFVRSTNEIFQLNLLSKAADIGNFLLNGQANIITANMFDPVPGTNKAWYAARITTSNLINIDTYFPAGGASVVSNTTGLFHLGFLNGGPTSGSRFGYFSNYSTVHTYPAIASASTCFGSSIQLTSNFISGANYSWTGPNNFKSSAYNPIINKATLVNTGTYYLSTNIAGCGVSFDSVWLAVHPLPTIVFSKSLDTVCLGSSKNVQFTLTGTSPWKFMYSDGQLTDTLKKITSASSYFTAKPTAKTVYSVLNIIDSNSCAMNNIPTATNFDTLLVNPLPVANFKYSLPNCVGKQINFLDSSITYLDTLTHWYWIIGNKDTIQQINKTAFTEKFTSWGNYSVKLAVQSAMGCKSDTTTKNIIVHPLPQLAFLLPEVCLNDAFAQFSDATKMADSNYNGLSYQWNFGDGNASGSNPNTSTIPNPKHKYSAIGKYNVQLIVQSGNLCVDSITQVFTVNGDNPKANFSLNNLATKCANDSVKITNLSTVDFGSVTWIKIYWDYLNNPNQFDSIPFPSSTGGDVYAHLYPNFRTVTQTKNFTIHFVAYSGTTCFNSKDTIITLVASPVVAFSTIPGICLNAQARQITEATETNNISGSFSYYGNATSMGGLFTPAIAGVGTDTIKSLFVSNVGCRDSAYNTITVWPLPTAKWGYSYPSCEKRAIIFTDSSTANFSNINTWNWNFGDSSFSVKNSATAFNKIYHTWGNYVAVLVVSTDSGCVSKPDSVMVNIHPLPKVNFAMPAIVCLPDGRAQFTDSTTIADSSSSLFTYQWSFGDTSNLSNSVLKNPVHQYTALGNYSIVLKVTSKDGCTDSLLQLFSKIYPQPKANFTTSNTAVCINSAIQFADATTGFTDSVIAWHWDLAEGYTATSANPYRIFADSGTFPISLYIFDAKGCISNVASKNVVVNPLPHVTLQHKELVLQGSSIVLKPVFYANSPVSFLWEPNTYLDSTTIAYPTTTPLDDITYQLTVTGKGNCSASDTVFVKLLRKPIIPNAFSPNGDGINDRWEIRYLTNYPNCEIKVFDRNGQPVFSSIGYNIPWDGTINGNPVPIGTYYYIINPKNGRATMSGSVTIIR